MQKKKKKSLQSDSNSRERQEREEDTIHCYCSSVAMSSDGTRKTECYDPSLDCLHPNDRIARFKIPPNFNTRPFHSELCPCLTPIVQSGTTYMINQTVHTPM